jgi:alpha-L-fucosidase
MDHVFAKKSPARNTPSSPRNLIRKSSIPMSGPAIAKSAGMKYVVITAKHHDGFSIFDSQVRRTYDVMDGTPLRPGRDQANWPKPATGGAAVRLLLLRSTATGIGRPGPGNERYKQSNTWDFPDSTACGLRYAISSEVARPAGRGVASRKYRHRTCIWFDGIEMKISRSKWKRVYNAIRELQSGHDGQQPDLVACRFPKDDPAAVLRLHLLRGQRDPGKCGIDFRVGEPRLDEHQLRLQSDTTTSGFRDQARSSVAWLDIVSKGGNYLLNVGPSGRGPHPPAQRRPAPPRWAAGCGSMAKPSTAPIRLAGYP